MSFEATEWALNDSPAADTTERLILAALGGKADSDGCHAFPSRRTMARIALCDVKTVQRKLKAMQERGLIRPGDQGAARYIPAHVRPVVYDLLIPASWYGAERLARVNEERRHRGLPPLTQDNRPAIGTAPPKRRRSDLGQKRSSEVEALRLERSGPTVIHRGDSQSPEGGLSVPGGGDSQSPGGGLSVPQPSPVTQSKDQPSSAAGDLVPHQRTDEVAENSAAADPDNKVIQEARQLLTALLPPEWRQNPVQTAQAVPEVAERLRHGWTADSLSHAITTRPEGLRNPAAAVLTRLRLLPLDPPRKPRSGAVGPAAGHRRSAAIRDCDRCDADGLAFNDNFETVKCHHDGQGRPVTVVPGEGQSLYAEAKSALGGGNGR